MNVVFKQQENVNTWIVLRGAISITSGTTSFNSYSPALGTLKVDAVKKKMLKTFSSPIENDLKK